MSPSTDEIWREFSARLRDFIRRRVRDPQDAEDILQEVFIRIHEHVGGLKEADRLAPWLYRIARNAVVDHQRRHAPSTESLDTVAEPAAGASDEVINAEVALWLRPMLDELPATYGQALAAVELSGRTQKQLAAEAGLTLSGAKSRVQRGRELLKERLLACCHLEFDRNGDIVAYERRRKPCCAETPPGR